MPIDLQALSKDPDFQKLSPADQQALMATAHQRNQAEQPSPVPSAISPETPSPWEALTGAFTGTQRLPGQAGAPEEGTAPETLGEVAGKESTAGKVITGVTGAVTSPSSIGEVVGTTLVPGPLKPFVGAGGAAIGEGYRQWQAGEPFDISKMGKEAAWSLVPEVAESTARATGRAMLRNVPGGQRLRFEEAARQARELPEKVFTPKPAAQISQAFDRVRATGMQIDMRDLGAHITTLSPGKQADVLNLLTTLDRQNMTGGRYAKLYQDLKAGKGTTSDIGTLQDLRSLLRQEAERLKDVPEARYVVRNLQGAVDDTIDTGVALGIPGAQAQATRDLLQTARKDYAHLRASEDLGQFVENNITSSPDLSSASLNLRSVFDTLRKGNSEISRSVNRALDLTPGARARFDDEITDIARQFHTIELPLTDVAGFRRNAVVAGVSQAISTLMLTERGREMFRGAVLTGRGQVSPNTLAMMANALRREAMPGVTRGPAASETSRAPGGVARTTD